MPLPADPVEAFITRWTAREGGAERANYQMFLSELCDVIGVPRPEPSGQERELNDYVFERAVRPRDSDAATAPKRIDLYRKNAFILEAKQSRLPGKQKAIPGQLSMLAEEPADLGKKSIARGWDVMMKNARQQAESYVFLLDAHHPAPPFIIVCDVGHCLELYADFTGTGRAYSHFPDRNEFRIYLHDLRDEATRTLLRRVWQEPHALDPSRESARVTRDIARRLAQVSKALEERGFHAEDVAHFLMRCIFTMFAEDVELLPEGAFTQLLKECIDHPDAFAPLLEELWVKMDEPQHERRFYSLFKKHLRHFNGNLFKQARAFPLGREDIGELWEASKAKWTEVDPAIFGTLLEQALDRTERRKLGAHYTPRAYVQRLVEATVMEPLREDWQNALRKAEHAKETGDEKAAIAIVRAFHRQLCATRVLDPACGTGNFLYVALELMKKLEGEVLETLAQLGEPESMGLDRETVDPHQFLGLELNPRAAAIAELVVWIGYLQQHYRNRTGHPSEPILRAFENINFGRRHGYDAVLTWDGYPVPQVAEKDGRRIETYPNARRPEWPEAEFIVGNPPFLGKGAAMRGPLGDSYVEALWKAHDWIDQSTDFVMYWWDRAAQLLTTDHTKLRRFGLVTTNSITGIFNRRTVDRYLNAKIPMSIVYTVPDHPWTKVSTDSASVRIAMTVAEAGKSDGVSQTITSEFDIDKDEPKLAFVTRIGRIHADLTIGANTSSSKALTANEGIACNGMMLAGQGFVLSENEARHIFDLYPTARKILKPFLNGGELVRLPKSRCVIDAFGLTADDLKRDYPHIYHHLLATVKPERDINRREAFRKRWWIFGEPRRTFRPALEGLSQYIGTTETAKHRIFQFIEADCIPDHMIIVIGSGDAITLGILSSRLHTIWALAQGGTLEDRPRYNKSRCFDPFPFPDPPESLKAEIRAVADELDAFRKQRQAEHPKLTLTQMYNVLEKLKAIAAARATLPSPLRGGAGVGVVKPKREASDAVANDPASASPSQTTPTSTSSPQGGGEMPALTPDEERIKDEGLILILKELHERLDRLVFQAYGWPETLTDEEILERLVALNAERAKEEAAGHVRWLRPDYQIPRFAKGAAAAKAEELDLATNVVAIDRALPDFPKDRHEDSLAVEQALLSAGRPMDAAALARGFKRGGKRIEPRIEQALLTLVRYGRITATADGRYLARKAA